MGWIGGIMAFLLIFSATFMKLFWSCCLTFRRWSSAINRFSLRSHWNGWKIVAFLRQRIHESMAKVFTKSANFVGERILEALYHYFRVKFATLDELFCLNWMGLEFQAEIFFASTLMNPKYIGFQLKKYGCKSTKPLTKVWLCFPDCIQNFQIKFKEEIIRQLR